MTREVSRRAFLRTSLLGMAGASLGVVGCGTTAPAAPTAAPAKPTAAPAKPTAAVQQPAQQAPAASRAVTIKVGHLARQLGNVVPRYQDVGPKHGINFDVVLFPDGAAVLGALTTGDILLGAPTKVQLVQAVQRGVDAVMLVGYDGGNNVFIANKSVDVPPGDWAALKAFAARKKSQGGQFRIGVPSSSLQHITLLQILQANGIDAQKDVEIVNVPFPEHANAVGNGQLDMAGAIPLFAGMAVQQGSSVVFKHANDTPLRHFDVGFITTRKLIDERPQEIQAIVNAHHEIMAGILADPTRGLATEVKYTELPEATVKKAYEFLTFDFRVDVQAIRGTEAAMRQIGLQREDLSGKIPEAVDLSFLSRASGKSVAELSTW